MTKEQEFRKQTEEAKFEAFSVICEKVTELEKKNTELEERIEELEKENTELKTIKIPYLERKIASIRGAHSVDCKKLKARTEQVERLKEENTELREKVKTLLQMTKSKSESNIIYERGV